MSPNGDKSTDGATAIVLPLDHSARSTDVCTVTEAADLLGVSRTRVFQLLSMGVLEGSKDGRCYQVTRRSIYRRIAKSETPPGVQRLLSYGRFIRDLTGVEAKPHKLAMSWQQSMQHVAWLMFGTEKAAPYKEKLHHAAHEIVLAGKLKDWARLERARELLHFLWLEYDFTAAPMNPIPTGRLVPKAVQEPLFRGGRA